MAISRVSAIWTGFNGAPGYTSLYFNAFGQADQVDLEVGRVVDAFASIGPRLPSSVEVKVQQEVEFLDEETGELLGYGLASEDPEPFEGEATSGYSAASGAIITWNTEAVARGRRLRGRTFFVPLGGSNYESDGTLNSAAISALQGFGDAMANSSEGPAHVVWSRPRNGAGGSIGDVVSYRVPDMAAVLRSRRD